MGKKWTSKHMTNDNWQPEDEKNDYFNLDDSKPSSWKALSTKAKKLLKKLKEEGLEAVLDDVRKRERKSAKSYKEESWLHCKEKYEVAVAFNRSPKEWTKFCNSDFWEGKTRPTGSERGESLRWALLRAAGDSRSAQKNASKQWTALKGLWVARTPPESLIDAIREGGGIANMAKRNSGLETSSNGLNGEFDTPLAPADQPDTFELRKAIFNKLVTVGDEVVVFARVLEAGKMLLCQATGGGTKDWEDAD